MDLTHSDVPDYNRNATIFVDMIQVSIQMIPWQVMGHMTYILSICFKSINQKEGNWIELLTAKPYVPAGNPRVRYHTPA